MPIDNQPKPTFLAIWAKHIGWVLLVIGVLLLVLSSILKHRELSKSKLPHEAPKVAAPEVKTSEGPAITQTETVAGAVSLIDQGFGILIELIHELGVALVIAGVAVLVIENVRALLFTQELGKVVKEKVDEIERKASDAILQGPLPRFFYEHVKRLALGAQVFRTKWEVELRLTNLNEETVQLAYDQQFTLQNLTGLEHIGAFVTGER